MSLADLRTISARRHDGADGRQGAVLELVVDHPDSDLNAVDAQLHDDLVRCFAALHEDEARAVVLTGAGRAFSAGGDLAWFPELAADQAALERLRVAARDLLTGLLDVPMPVVAAVNGPAVGLGASVALLCDVVFAARSASLADPHVLVGLVAGDGGTVAWPLAVGPARAKEHLLTGDPVAAEEAERIGLVNHVVDDADLHAEALAFARRLAAGAPLALRYTKAAVNAGIKARLLESFEPAVAHELVTFRSDDHHEALAARREGRPPRFEGR